MSDECEVEDLAKKVCPCGNPSQHNPNESIECAWALDLTRALLAALQGVTP